MKRAIAHLSAADPVLAGIIERVGPYRMSYREPTFGAVARAIVFQQLNGKAAGTIWQRVVDAARAQCLACANGLTAGDAPTGDGINTLLPIAILGLSEGDLRACGLSKQKLSYIRDLAARTKSGEIDFAAMPKWTDEQVIEH